MAYRLVSQLHRSKQGPAVTTCYIHGLRHHRWLSARGNFRSDERTSAKSQAITSANAALAVTLLDLTAYEDSLSSPKVERGLLQPIS
jgi:hypothetical protein